MWIHSCTAGCVMVLNRVAALRAYIECSLVAARSDMHSPVCCQLIGSLPTQRAEFSTFRPKIKSAAPLPPSRLHLPRVPFHPLQTSTRLAPSRSRWRCRPTGCRP